jgi:hypothetical protein
MTNEKATTSNRYPNNALTRELAELRQQRDPQPSRRLQAKEAMDLEAVLKTSEGRRVYTRLVRERSVRPLLEGVNSRDSAFVEAYHRATLARMALERRVYFWLSMSVMLAIVVIFLAVWR